MIASKKSFVVKTFINGINNFTYKMKNKTISLLILLLVSHLLKAQVYVVKDSLVFYYDKEIKNADPSSFNIIHYKMLEYAKDKNYVYYKGEKTHYDAKTFDIKSGGYREPTYFYDKNDVYLSNYNGTSHVPIGSVSPKSFLRYDNNIGVDNESIYWKEFKHSNSDAKTLDFIVGNIFRDKNRVYYEKYELPIDTNSIQYLKSNDGSIVYVADNSKICNNSGTCNLMNVALFEYFNWNYSKDDKKVLYRNGYLKADAKTFHLPNPKISHYAKDKYHQFYLGDAFPTKVDDQFLVNDKAFKSYYNWTKKQLKNAFSESQYLDTLVTEPKHLLKELYTFVNSNNTKIEKGKYIYMNGKPQPFIDAPSFKIYNNDYAKDKNNAYLIYEYSNYVTFNKIQGLTSKSFSIIKKDNKYSAYCKDSNAVYNGLHKVEGADPDSFQTITEDFSTDKNAIFYNDQIISNLKPRPNTIIKKIDKNYYSYGNKILFIDTYKDVAEIINKPQINSFKVINNQYALNNNEIIFRGKIVGHLSENETVTSENNNDITTSKNRMFSYGVFKNMKNKRWIRKHTTKNYLTDGLTLFTQSGKEVSKLNNIYSASGYTAYITFKNGKAVYKYSDELFDVDLSTFQPFYSSDYAKDKNQVYYKDKIIGYDSKTFHYLGNKFSADKNGVYYDNKLIENADVASFNTFGNYGFDKNNFYHRGKFISRSKVDLKK